MTSNSQENKSTSSCHAPLPRQYGEQGQNTKPLVDATFHTTILAPDGFTVVEPGSMYRPDETHPGRREPSFPNLHNLHTSAIQRTLTPPSFFPPNLPSLPRRATIWDKTASAVRAALTTLPPNTHIAIAANSGPYNPQKLEPLPPSSLVPGAAYGLLLVAEFRDAETEPVHTDWIQIACPINPSEGRLLAGLRLLPAVLGDRKDLTFTVTNLTYPTIARHHMNLIKDSEIPYGSVLNSWKPTNLGCFFHRGGLWAGEYEVVRGSFAWDGDLYGWDEAVVYTRRPVAAVSDRKPERRFETWVEGMVLRGVTWLRVDEGGRLRGGFVEETRRGDVVRWDGEGVPEGWIPGLDGEEGEG
ncbi:hypothetical protein QBC34DRAFT_309470 [Podospora aff. communis PSN243]|uniref:Uncharacterized protein n=1 Tax=Podospora aff. communis PSN243 TaxID=3040156 RepID=A0AAV9G9Z2_9PEZI|nr:hypothetical protein QBC34DRAFT_309470 [Podospora aff. communis PSN243]